MSKTPIRIPCKFKAKSPEFIYSYKRAVKILKGEWDNDWMVINWLIDWVYFDNTCTCICIIFSKNHVDDI